MEIEQSFLERTWKNPKYFGSHITSLWTFIDMITDILAIMGYYWRWDNVSIFFLKMFWLLRFNVLLTRFTLLETFAQILPKKQCIQLFKG